MDTVEPSGQCFKNGNKKDLSKEKIFILTKIKKHKNWTREEDRRLIEVANLYRQKSWTKVAEYFGDKNAAQCRARYKRIRPGIVKGAWTKEEDDMIIELVDKSGKNWALISKLMPTRNGKQIRDRFLNYLDPNINKIKFTEEDDKNIIDYYKIYGTKWSKIAKYFEGRTGDMIKNRFYSCLKRKVHIYEVNTNKRIRKKYYKSKRPSFTNSLPSSYLLDQEAKYYRNKEQTATKHNQNNQEFIEKKQLSSTNNNNSINSYSHDKELGNGQVNEQFNNTTLTADSPNNLLGNNSHICSQNLQEQNLINMLNHFKQCQQLNYFKNYDNLSNYNMFAFSNLMDLNNNMNYDYTKNPHFNPVNYTQNDLLYLLNLNYQNLYANSANNFQN